MKKFLKVLIAFVVIFAIAVGIYFIFFRKSNNANIYNKVNYFNNQIIENNVNVVKTVDETMLEMLVLIEQNNFDVEESKQFLTVYTTAQEAYGHVKNSVLTYGLFTNKVNVKNHVKNLEKAEKKLESLYKEGYSYLTNHYFNTEVVGAKKEYIINFCNMFKGALNELNNFYYSAGMALVLATDNTLDYTNANKLKTEAYVLAVSTYVNEYLKETETKTISEQNLIELETNYNSITAEYYLNNKKVFDNLFNARASLNVQKIITKHFDGTIEEYINEVKNETQKSNIQNYYNLIIKG